MSFCNETTVANSRRAHWCQLCGELIRPGSSYVRRSGVGEGGDAPCSAALHAECVAYEHSIPWSKRAYWYADASDPMFEHSKALRWYAANVSPYVVTEPELPLGAMLRAEQRTRRLT